MVCGCFDIYLKEHGKCIESQFNRILDRKSTGESIEDIS